MRRFSVVASGLFACVGACKDDGKVNDLPDAPVFDDGSPGDGPANTVTVTALARSFTGVPAGTPYEGALVFGVSTQGNFVATATTGADGKATVTLPTGGTVTVVYPTDGKSNNTVITYAGVKPGDTLTFGDRDTFFHPATGQSGTMTVNWEAVPNATQYRLYTPCGTFTNLASTTAQVALDPTCQTDTATIGLAASDDTGAVLASVVFPATVFTPDTVLDVTAAQWVAQAPANYTMTLTNLDPGAFAADFSAFDEFAFGEYGPFWFSFPPGVDFSVQADPDTKTVTDTFSIAGTAPHPSAAAKLYHNTFAGRLWLFKAGASPVTIDTGTLPWIDTVTLDAQARTLAWTQSAGTYDAAALRFSWSNFDWTVILPPGVNSLDASAPPSELAPYMPTAADGLNMFGCELIDLASAASYDDVRALPEWRVTGAENSVRVGEEPAAVLADCGEGFHF